MTEAETSPLLPVYPRLDLELISATGCWLKTADGQSLLDLYGGHAVSPLGHGHPELAGVLASAYAKLDFYSNSLHIPQQEEAARALLALSDHLGFVHFVNSGTEANEAAIHVARCLTGRTKILSFDCSFHGRTLGTLAASGLDVYRKRLRLPLPLDHYDVIPFDDMNEIERVDEQTAAVLCETIPSLAGVRMAGPDYYPALAQRCRDVGALVICDEVQGGMGRVGRWFAHQIFGIEPDLVTLAKSLAAGYPAGALLATPEIGARVEVGELGTTFGGGPVACQMIATVIRLIDVQNLLVRNAHIYQRIASGLAPLPDCEVRGAGCLIGVQTNRPARDLRNDLLKQGVLVGLSADPSTIRLLPPYVLGDDEIDIFLQAMREIVSTV